MVMYVYEFSCCSIDTLCILLKQGIFLCFAGLHDGRTKGQNNSKRQCLEPSSSMNSKNGLSQRRHSILQLTNPVKLYLRPLALNSTNSFLLCTLITSNSLLTALLIAQIATLTDKALKLQIRSRDQG